MIYSLSRFTMELMATLVLLQIALTFTSAIPINAEFQLDQDSSVSSDSDDLSPMSKDQFKQDMTRQLLLLQEAEADVVNQIRKLEAQRIALSKRKRSRYSNMCMFNVVACYKKRR